MTRLARARCLILVPLLLAGIPSAGAWDVTTESVTAITYNPTNIATIWGYHQPLIVRAGDGVYCALLEPYGDGFAQQWSLYERGESGWRRVWSSPREGELNQPPSIVADRQGSIHVFAWPDAIFTHWRFEPGPDGAIAAEPVVDTPSSPYNDLWPYAAVAVNDSDELLAVASAYPQNLFSVRSEAVGGWRRGRVFLHPERPDSPSGYDRQAYPYVALKGRTAHVFTTQDIADSAKIAAGLPFVYSFRNLQYYYTPDILSEPFTETTVVDVEGSGGWVHNDDLLIDRDGTVHLLFQVMRTEGDWGDVRTVHAFGRPGGPFEPAQLGSPGEFNSGRLWESPDGVLYTVQPRYTDLHVAPLGADGRLAHEPVDLGLTSTGWGFFGRCFVVNQRSSAGGAPYLEGLYFVQLGDGESEVRYFRATPPPSNTAVLERHSPTLPRSFTLDQNYPNPFNSATVIRFALSTRGDVELSIFNLAGQKVATLMQGVREGGTYTVHWDGRDDDGRALASGVYLYRLQTGNRQQMETRKLVLLR